MTVILTIVGAMGASIFISCVIFGVFLISNRRPSAIEREWGGTLDRWELDRYQWDNPIPYALNDADAALQASRDRLDSYVKPINNHTRRV